MKGLEFPRAGSAEHIGISHYFALKVPQDLLDPFAIGALLRPDSELDRLDRAPLAVLGKALVFANNWHPAKVQAHLAGEILEEFGQQVGFFTSQKRRKDGGHGRSIFADRF